MTGEIASADQQAGDKFLDAVKKIIQWKGYLLEHVFNVDKSALFWKKMPQKTFISKEEKRTPGFKAGRDRLSLLFCANVVVFMIWTSLIYKAANP